MQLKNKEEIAEALMHLLMSKPDANVMVLLDDPGGIHILATQESMIWSLGLLEVAKTMMDESLRTSIDYEASRRIEEQNNKIVEDGLNITKKEVH